MIVWQEYIHLKTRKSIGVWLGFLNDALAYTVGKNPVTNFWSFRRHGSDDIFSGFETAQEAMRAAELDLMKNE